MKRTIWIRWMLSLVLVAAASWLATAYWFGRDIPDPSIQQRTLASSVLGEERTYFVHLPDSYARSPKQRYPVFYVLDGTSQSVHTANTAELMARIGAMPEAIVIGIPSGDARNRDYTPPGMRQDADDGSSGDGQADRFLGFLQRELIPQVEHEFRTAPSRTLVGNSRGGLLVMHAFIAQPSLFDAWIANSPALWRDDAAMVTRLDRFLRGHRDLQGRLFLSLGGDENPKMTAAYRKAIAVLRREAPPGLRWRASTTPGAVHDDNARKATPVALHWLHRLDSAASPSSSRGSPTPRR
ncbi:alpha/beta hydrolase [Thermomonas carbonis]|uniref:Alpha/beta hydrolase n=1 Tax=Thermomonas carbonis TaxID=1463158 RepID=A0A7G9SS49_9GAMM|nr:alpha/beta hydrolase-fold protein [Thermomonas carbonis]QNN70674.1 alpha/beta hydrolase [Thermomonas carbonis]GHC01572.1 alpha/beta family hydrolase [Thermomonas carbonis]